MTFSPVQLCACEKINSQARHVKGQYSRESLQYTPLSQNCIGTQRTRWKPRLVLPSLLPDPRLSAAGEDHPELLFDEPNDEVFDEPTQGGADGVAH